jgi:hypothetical protein
MELATMKMEILYHLLSKHRMLVLVITCALDVWGMAIVNVLLAGGIGNLRRLMVMTSDLVSVI